MTPSLLVQLVVVSLGIASARAAKDDDGCSRVVTFNAGLINRVPEYEKRAQRVPQALLDLDADVYCLQEIWLESDLRPLLDEVSSTYPYHYSVLHHSVGQLTKPRQRGVLGSLRASLTAGSACSVRDLPYFMSSLACAASHGCLTNFTSDPIKSAACLVQECRGWLQSDNLSADCIACVFLMGTSPTTAFDKCTKTPFQHSKRLNAPGLVLLSKKEVKSACYRSFFPEQDLTIQRGYIQADIDGLGTVICTHLSAQTDHYLEYNLQYPSYGVQQTAEIQTLLELASEWPPHVLLGDLNSGLAQHISNTSENDTAVCSELPENYQLFLDAGYTEPYSEQDGRCTFCDSNPLTDYCSITIDQVLLMGGHLEALEAKRVLDETDPSGLPLSDHYGVEATLCPSETSGEPQ